MKCRMTSDGIRYPTDFEGTHIPSISLPVSSLGITVFFGGELKRDVCLQLFTYIRIEQNGCSDNKSLVDADVDMLLKPAKLFFLVPSKIA